MTKTYYKVQLVAGKTRVCFFNDSQRHTLKATKLWMTKQKRPSPAWQPVKITEEVVE